MLPRNAYLDIVDRMKKIGYTDGKCLGFVMPAIQASLIDELDIFKARLQLIRQIPIEDFSSIQLLYSKWPNDAYQIIATFDAVALYQTPDDYLEMFDVDNRSQEQDIARSMSIAYSDKLGDDGGVEIGKFSGIYSWSLKKTLTQYFLTLQKSIESSMDMTSPISLLLITLNHSVAIEYHPVKKIWCMVDINSVSIFSEFPLGTENKLTEAVAGAFQLDRSSTVNYDISIFTTIMYSNKTNKLKTQQIYEGWINDPEMKKIIDITPVNADYFANDTSLLFLASRLSIPQEVDTLLKAGACPLKQNAEGRIPLHYVIDIIVADRLLKADKEQVQHADINGYTPVHLAAVLNKVSLVNLFLSAGADKNVISAKKETPLWLAISANSTNVAIALLQAGANPNLTNEKGMSPLSFAVFKQNLELMKGLLNNGADPDQKYNNTPLLFAAAQLGYTNVCIELLSAGANPVAIFKSNVKGFREYAVMYHVETAMEEFIKEKSGSDEGMLDMKAREIAHIMGHDGIETLLAGAEKKQLDKVSVNPSTMYNKKNLSDSIVGSDAPSSDFKKK